MENCKIRVNNPQHSAAIQRHLFAQGVGWSSLEKVVQHCSASFLYVDLDSTGRRVLTYGNDLARFQAEKGVQMSLDRLDPHLAPASPLEVNTLTALREAKEALKMAQDAYTEALEAFRKEAEGWLGKTPEAPENGPQEDMKDSQNWEKGDLVTCNNPEGWPDLTMNGRLSLLTVTKAKGEGLFLEIEGKRIAVPQSFTWHSRPQ